MRNSSSDSWAHPCWVPADRVTNVPYPLHQALTFPLDRVVRIQDYPDRASALGDIGL
jgi:hypothetical protein